MEKEFYGDSYLERAYIEKANEKETRDISSRWKKMEYKGEGWGRTKYIGMCEEILKYISKNRHRIRTGAEKWERGEKNYKCGKESKNYYIKFRSILSKI